MKKGLHSLLLICSLLLPWGKAFSKNSNSTDKVAIVDQKTGRTVGTMTYREFDALVKGADAYVQLLQSEEAKLLKLQTQNPIVLVEDLENPISFQLVWYDSQGVVLKTVTIDMRLPFKNTNSDGSRLRRAFRDIAEFGFPLTTIVLILVIAL